MITNREIEQRLVRFYQELRKLRREVASRPDSYEDSSPLLEVDVRIGYAEASIVGAIQCLAPPSEMPPIPNDPEVSCAVDNGWIS